MQQKILYIAGAGHSGSTLLDLVVSTDEEAFSVGELKLLKGSLEKGRRDDQGYQLTASPLWAPIVEDKDKLINDEKDSYELNWREKLSLLIFGKIAERNSLYNCSKLYWYIRYYAQPKVAKPVSLIIDSSKNIPQLAALQQEPDIEVYVIHLVRDVRGVANSARRRGFGVVKESMRWLWLNVLLKRYLGGSFAKEKFRTIYYEDFTRNPAVTIQEINAWLGTEVPVDTLYEQMNSEVSWRFAGNRMRWKEIDEITPDTAWQHELPIVHKYILVPVNILV